MSTKTGRLGLNIAEDSDYLRTVLVEQFNENWAIIDSKMVNMDEFTAHTGSDSIHVQKDGSLQAGLNAEMVGGIRAEDLARADHTHPEYCTKAEADASYMAAGSAYTRAELNDLLTSNTVVYTRTEADSVFAQKSSVYTRAEIDSLLASSRAAGYIQVPLGQLDFYWLMNTKSLGLDMSGKDAGIVWGDPDRVNIKGGLTENPGHPYRIDRVLEFNGALYIAGAADSGACIYRYDTSYTTVLNDTSLDAFHDLASFGGKLYACGTGNGGTYGAIYETTDGQTWTRVMDNWPSRSLVVINGSIIALNGTDAASSTGGAFSVQTGVLPESISITGSLSLPGSAYAAGLNASGVPVVFKTTDGTSWTPVWTGTAGDGGVRAMTAWTIGQTAYILWGTGTSGLVLYYSTDTGETGVLFDYKDGGEGINDINASGTPWDGSGTPLGYMEKGITDLLVYTDQRGNSYVLVGTANCQQAAYESLYYKDGRAYTAEDVAAITGEHNYRDNGSTTTDLSSVYIITPGLYRSESKDTLCTGPLKRINDTAVGRMALWNGKLYIYSGGPGAAGKGLAYEVTAEEITRAVRRVMYGLARPAWWTRGQGMPGAAVVSGKESGVLSIYPAEIESGRVELLFAINELASTERRFIRLIYACSDESSYYCAEFEVNTGTLRAIKVEGGIEMVLASGDAGLELEPYSHRGTSELMYAPYSGPIYTLTAEVTNTDVSVYIKKAGTVDLGSSEQGQALTHTLESGRGKTGFAVINTPGVSLIGFKLSTQQ